MKRLVLVMPWRDEVRVLLLELLLELIVIFGQRRLLQ